jgi:hypothetical protein
MWKWEDLMGQALMGRVGLRETTDQIDQAWVNLSFLATKLFLRMA